MYEQYIQKVMVRQNKVFGGKFMSRSNYVFIYRPIEQFLWIIFMYKIVRTVKVLKKQILKNKMFQVF